ncbi:MAG: hypothetical protein Q9162_003392 [Coniocarpon cinnabarinum]
MPSLRALTLATVAATTAWAASDVTQLQADTFEPFVKEHDLVLAEFFAPWCGHCKALAPEYEEAATTLKEKNIQLAKVDCTEEADLCQTYGVEGYPTLKVFRGPDSITPYAGQRKAPAIVSYMTKQSLPPVSTITKDTIEDFKTADKVVLIAYVDSKDKASNETFTSVAESLRDFCLFGATSDAELAKEEGVKAPSIVLYKTFDEGKDVYEGQKFTEENIRAFLKSGATPLVGEVGPETYAEYMAAQIPLGYIFVESPEEKEKLSAEMKPIAQKHKGAINLATIDAGAFGQHAQNLNLEVGKWPAFAIQETVKNEKYPLDQKTKINAKNVGKFVDDFVAGKLEPSVKSEPVPKSQDGPVTVIVAHNWKDVVMDSKKDVLVEFYAPWCGHCKALAPKYDELGSLFANTGATIAKVDATANDVPEEIGGFPTIKLYPADAKDKPIDYSGARTVEDLAKFVKENGSLSVDYNIEEAETDEEKIESKSASETMQHQAPAASKVKEAAQKVMDAGSGGDEGVEDHDEL